jgi:hypothetical protein
MEDVLKVDVEEEELRELEDDVEGEEWPERGMTCPVAGCRTKRHHFAKLANFKAHYQRFHRKRIQLFSCPECGVKDSKRAEITRHHRKNHKGKSLEDIPWKIVENKKYVNPGSFHCPKKRIHRTERERARIARQESLPRKPLFELGEEYNARDQRYPQGGFKHV